MGFGVFLHENGCFKKKSPSFMHSPNMSKAKKKKIIYSIEN